MIPFHGPRPAAAGDLLATLANSSAVASVANSSWYYIPYLADEVEFLLTTGLIVESCDEVDKYQLTLEGLQKLTLVQSAGCLGSILTFQRSHSGKPDSLEFVEQQSRWEMMMCLGLDGWSDIAVRERKVVPYTVGGEKKYYFLEAKQVLSRQYLMCLCVAPLLLNSGLHGLMHFQPVSYYSTAISLLKEAPGWLHRLRGNQPLTYYTDILHRARHSNGQPGDEDDSGDPDITNKQQQRDKAIGNKLEEEQSLHPPDQPRLPKPRARKKRAPVAHHKQNTDNMDSDGNSPSGATDVQDQHTCNIDGADYSPSIASHIDRVSSHGKHSNSDSDMDKDSMSRELEELSNCSATSTPYKEPHDVDDDSNSKRKSLSLSSRSSLSPTAKNKQNKHAGKLQPTSRCQTRAGEPKGPTTTMFADTTVWFGDYPIIKRSDQAGVSRKHWPVTVTMSNIK